MEMTGKRFVELMHECEAQGVSPVSNPELEPYLHTEDELAEKGVKVDDEPCGVCDACCVSRHVIYLPKE